MTGIELSTRLDNLAWESELARESNYARDREFREVWRNRAYTVDTLPPDAIRDWLRAGTMQHVPAEERMRMQQIEREKRELWVQKLGDLNGEGRVQ